ncbi:MAG: hypothetical protein KGO03_09625, partial [Gemmatimonadota bacterium]|nr:hypothetical protein [Gemmatimonadota bacterium]
ADTLPKPSKPAPANVVVLRLAPGAKLLPLTQYRVTATDLVNLMGYKGTSTRVFATPKAPAKADTTKTKGAAPRDTSTAKPPAKPGGGRGGRGGAFP